MTGFLWCMAALMAVALIGVGFTDRLYSDR
jgi:hypothetical protein